MWVINDLFIKKVKLLIKNSLKPHYVYFAHSQKKFFTTLCKAKKPQNTIIIWKQNPHSSCFWWCFALGKELENLNYKISCPIVNFKNVKMLLLAEGFVLWLEMYYVIVRRGVIMKIFCNNKLIIWIVDCHRVVIRS